MVDCLEGRVLQRLGFRELAFRFVDSFNPPLGPRAIVVADAIVSFDGPLDCGVPLRYQADEFVWEAVRVIVRGERDGGGVFGDWVVEWNSKFGA